MKIGFSPIKTKVTKSTDDGTENEVLHEANEVKTASESALLAVPEFRQADLEVLKADEALLALVPESLARKHKFIPVEIKSGTLKIAMANPRDYDAVNNIGVYTKMRISVLRADADAIEDKIREMYTTQRAYAAAREISGSAETEKDTAREDSTQPIIRFVNNMIEQAVISRASDIHIEPEEKNCESASVWTGI